MSEPTGVQTLAERSVEELVELARSEVTCAEQAQRQAEHHEARARAAASELAERVSRPGAAKLLGITPRELAGILRGSRQ